MYQMNQMNQTNLRNLRNLRNQNFLMYQMNLRSQKYH
jgi:hypothetical protein